MSSPHLRVVSLASMALWLCTSCSENHQPGGNDPSGRQSTSSPDISLSAAPGVAFNYGYEFSLPDDRIGSTQEIHAAACEKLGLQRCRITGMSYTVDQTDQVDAELDLKLDPLIARQFGKTALQTVEGNDGKLVRLQIGSSDEGKAIDQASAQRRDSSAQLAQLQQELQKAKPGTAARANLMGQVQDLQNQVSDARRSIQASQTALASTPMELHYYGRGGVPGFRGNPIREAWRTFIGTVVWLAGILLQALAVLIPLAGLLAALIWLSRTRPVRATRRWIFGAREP